MKDSGFRVLVGTPRMLSAKRKHPKKRGMQVSLAATDINPIVIAQTKECGTDARDSKGFREILERARINCGIKRPDPIRRKPISVTTSARHHIHINPPSINMIESVKQKESQSKITPQVETRKSSINNQRINQTIQRPTCHESSTNKVPTQISKGPTVITEKIRKKWRELFDDDSDVIQFQISEGEQKEMDKLIADQNNNKMDD